MTPTPPISPIALWQCADCGATRFKPERRPPSGWKKGKDGTLYCQPCWRKRYILRAVTIAVAAPAEGTWEELRKVLRTQWILTTHATNWILTELYARDVRRTGDEDKMPPMKYQYLYKEVRDRFPGLPSATCAALAKSVTARYVAKRYEIIWTCASVLPTHRYPVPFPVPNQVWSVEMEGNQPVVGLRLGSSRVRLLLRSGVRYRRQIESIRLIASGEAEPGEMAIYAQGNDILCKMVAWLPRRQAALQRGPDILLVRSAAESLIVALNAKDEKLWVYNGDQIRQWSAEHRKRLKRWSEDSKAEHLPSPPFAEKREFAAVRYRHRMSTACHQIAEMIAGYAARRRFAAVAYDDTVREFCLEFPWAMLAARIAEKCDAAGLTYAHRGAEEAPEEELGGEAAVRKGRKSKKSLSLHQLR